MSPYQNFVIKIKMLEAMQRELLGYGSSIRRCRNQF